MTAEQTLAAVLIACTAICVLAVASLIHDNHKHGGEQ